MRPNIEVMCIVKFQYATSAMLGKSNLLCTWLLAETPLRLEPLLIYGHGMQIHHLQSILRSEKVIGRPCLLPCNWMICISTTTLYMQ